MLTEHPARHQHRHIGERVMQLIAAFADVLELVDQVEEGEKPEEGHKDHRRGAVDLARDVTEKNRVHARARQNGDTASLR